MSELNGVLGRGLSLLVACFAILVVVSGSAFATGTVDLTGITLDTGSVLQLAGIVLVAIGAIWGIKKLVKLANRS